MQSCGDSDRHLSGSGVKSCGTEWYDGGREGGLCNTAPGEPNAKSWGRMAAVLARPHIDQKRCLGVSFCRSDGWTLVGTAGCGSKEAPRTSGAYARASEELTQLSGELWSVCSGVWRRRPC